MTDIDRIYRFWIEEIGPDRWFEASAALDARIANEFQWHWHEAMAGRLHWWNRDARGSLSYLILTDQFPRNMFRGTAKAFASDHLARTAAKTAIGRGFDKRIPEPERSHFYMPLMHSETLPDQEQCVRQIMLSMPATGTERLPYATKHRAVIRAFGRFPSRNAALGRTDSDAEIAYREAGGYMS